MYGDEQACGAPPESVHWKDVPNSSGGSAWKVNVAVCSFSTVAPVSTPGPSVIVMTGGVMSPISQLNRAGVGSTFSGLTFARTANSCSPTARPL